MTKRPLARLAYAFMPVLAFAFVFAFAAVAIAAPTAASVGEKIYFDTNLSQPTGMSCATCHDPNAGFADPRTGTPTSAGVVVGRFGNRNSPTAAYAFLSPTFRYDSTLGQYVGGQFWDGRAATLVEQAKGPFLNPLEMNLPSAYEVVRRVAASTYAKEFKRVYGSNSLSLSNVASSYDNIAKAIAAYESSPKVNPFSSKHDYAMTLSGPERMGVFTASERRGMMLFAVNCANCHPGTMMGGGGMDGGGMGGGGRMGGGGGGGMGGGGGGMGMGSGAFTDFTYDNLGLPRNPANPFYTISPEFNPEQGAWTDHGLAGALPGGVAANPLQDGKFKVPTLRNVAKTAPYGHNGYFATLKDIVHFYNTRDVDGAGWPAPEVAANVNDAELGNLGLSDSDENDIVAFLGTLTDGYYTP